MKRKLFSIVMSFVLALVIILSPLQAYAETLEFSDNFVEEKNEEPVVQDELVDDLAGSMAPINPEYNKVMANNNDEKFYGLRVSPVLFNSNYDKLNERSNEPWRNAQRAPRAYDLREHNRVTPVKNQGPNGSCWAFATFGSAESVLMPGEFTDFSEKNMRNTHGYDWGPDQGGTWQVASGYLTRGSGPIAERDEPYSPYGFTSPRGLVRVKDVDKILNIPDVRGGWDTDTLKEAIMEHGAAYTTINGSEYYLNTRTMGSYNPGRTGYANHAVTIVGWDDNFSRYNFGITPPGDGAWIIKNSWGQNWKYMGGYYYVSYYDGFVGRSNAIFKFKNKVPNEEIWYYDYLGMTNTYGNGPTGYFANVFGPVNSSKDVYQVGFFVPSNGARYEIYMSKGRGQVSFNDRVKVAEGTVTYAGYVNVPISKYTVGQGEYFSPIVKLTTPGYNYPIPLESYVWGYSSRARANRGESYISYDGRSWSDMTNYQSNSNVCVKAMTVPAGSSPSYDKKVESITFRENPITLNVGSTYVLNPSIAPADARNKKLNYTVSPSGIVSINSNTVRALRKGTATITATATDGSYKRSTLTVNVVDNTIVEDKKVSSISISPRNKTITVGETYRLNTSITPADAKNKSLRFAVDNASVASVSANGTVKGLRAGKTRITATAQDGSGVSQSAYVIVENANDNNDNNDNDANALKVSSSLASTTVRAGYSQTVTVNAKDVYNRNLRYVLVNINVNGPNGINISKQAYTDYYGNARFTLNSNEIRSEGQYTVNITASGGTYKTTTDTLNFTVNDGRPTFDVSVTPREKEIMNNGEIQLQIKTTANGRNVRYANLDIEITTADGTVHRNTGRTNFYGNATYNYKPDNGPVGIYKVKVTASSTSYQDAVATTEFKVTKYKNPYFLKANIAADKANYQMGDRATVNITITDQNNRYSRRTPVEINVSGPNNFNYNLTKYTDYYGRTAVYITPTPEMGEGEYVVSINASRNGYDPAKEKASLVFGTIPDPVDPDPVDPVDPVDPDPVDPIKPEENIYKMIETDEGQKMIEANKNNEDFVLLDVRTKAEYNESHIEGCVHHDYYQKDHTDFIKTLDKNKTYLLYCRTQVRSGATAEIMKNLGFKKIYWMNGGMTKWLRENRPSVFPEYEKALDLNVGADKTAYTANSSVLVEGNITDLDGNGIRKADIVLELKDENGRTIDSAKMQSSNTGTISHRFTAPSANAKYTVFVEASYKDFKKAHGLASFYVEDQAREFKSYAARKASGQFSHLKAEDFEFDSLKKYYGKNILQYFVKDANLGDHRLADLIDPSKKTVLVFGYPGCGACVDMWKDMAPLPHDKYNFIEVVTSVEEDVKSTVKFVDNVLRDLKIEQFKDHIYYDADEKIWASRLGFLTTPNTVVLDENGRLVNIAGALDKDGLYSLLKKTLNLDPEADEVDTNRYNSTLSLDFDKDEIGLNETVKMTARLRDLNGKAVYREKLRYTIKYPNGAYETETYDRVTGYTGETNLYFTTGAQSVEGKHEITVEVISDGYVAQKVTKSFNYVKKANANYDLDLSFGGENFKKGDVIRMVLTVKDAQGNLQRGKRVRFTFTYPDGKSYNYDRQTDYYGKASLTFTTNYNVPEGKFTLSAVLTDESEYSIEKSFTIGSGSDPVRPDPNRPDNNGSLSYNDRYNRGEFNHLQSGDLGPKLRGIYGRDVTGYTLTNMQGQNVSIASLIDGRRPTVIAMGYPSCGGCQASWRSLVNIDKSGFNMVEAMTSGDARSITATLNRLGLSQMLPYFHYNARSLFNIVSSNYVPCLLYLDKDGRVTNLSYFNSNAEVLSIVRTIGNTTSR